MQVAHRSHNENTLRHHLLSTKAAIPNIPEWVQQPGDGIDQACNAARAHLVRRLYNFADVKSETPAAYVATLLLLLQIINLPLETVMMRAFASMLPRKWSALLTTMNSRTTNVHS